jgi:hypothetical protein
MIENQGNNRHSINSGKISCRVAIEKDFPNGVEPSLSAEQIDHIPDEFENRLPDFCVNENNAWLVDERTI